MDGPQDSKFHAEHLAPPSAATKPARRTAPDPCRWTPFAIPNLWYFATSASKQVFTRRNREGNGGPRSNTNRRKD